MEYVIIFLLLIFLIIVIVLKQIKAINKFNTKNNKYNNIINYPTYKKYLYTYYNPVLLYLYETMYIQLKKISKYDYKSYIIFSKLKISHENNVIFDWISYSSGIIKMAIDSVIKIIKNKNTIPNDFINIIIKIKLYYNCVYGKINEKDIYKKFKIIKNNKVLFNLYYIYEIITSLYNDIFNNLDKSKLSKGVKQIINKNKDKNDIYLYNSYLNNKLTNKYLIKSNSLFYDYFIKL